MSPETLALYLQCPLSRAQVWADSLSAAMALFDISTDLRQAAFLAQIGHESAGLRYTKEIWGPTKAQLGYEGRADLGNTEPGDGKRFMGHGPIQVTGRANHRQMGIALTGNPNTFLDNPELLCEPDYGSASACFFWVSRDLNKLADKEDIKGITRKINGGYNGLEDRTTRYKRIRALQAFNREV